MHRGLIAGLHQGLTTCLHLRNDLGCVNIINRYSTEGGAQFFHRRIDLAQMGIELNLELIGHRNPRVRVVGEIFAQVDQSRAHPITCYANPTGPLR